MLDYMYTHKYTCVITGQQKENVKNKAKTKTE